MEKTLNFALNEAIENGYRAGRLSGSFDEAALREIIAQQLEALDISTSHNLDYVKAKMIAMVRGIND